jgi:hypothetical protein
MFTNKERHRHYGKRVGDIVSVLSPTGEDFRARALAEVALLGYGDNNSLYIAGETGPVKHVAEWCDLIIPVEKRRCGGCKTLIMPYQKFVPFRTTFRHVDCTTKKHV